jgi:hypothetical protein
VIARWLAYHWQLHGLFEAVGRDKDALRVAVAEATRLQRSQKITHTEALERVKLVRVLQSGQDPDQDRA